jgi:hypothetical protein
VVEASLVSVVVEVALVFVVYGGRLSVGRMAVKTSDRELGLHKESRDIEKPSACVRDVSTVIW